MAKKTDAVVEKTSPVGIDGHYQLSSNGWQFFTSLQPGLPCYDKDHKRCKEMSAAYAAQLSAQGKAALDAAQASKKAEIDLKAEELAASNKAAEVAEAANRKGDAARAVRTKLDEALAAAEKAYIEGKAAWQGRYVEAMTALEQDYREEVDDASATARAESAEIDAKDWSKK